MARDYARKAAIKGNRPRVSVRLSSRRAKLIACFLGVGLLMGVVVHHYTTLAQIDHRRYAQVHEAHPAYSQETKATPPGGQPIRFEFYSMLSEQPTPIPVQTHALPVTPNGLYVLQIASFYQEKPARALQARLLDKGFRTHVVHLTLSSGKQVFRVESGPFPSLTEAQKVQAGLKSAQQSSLLRQFHA